MMSTPSPSRALNNAWAPVTFMDSSPSSRDRFPLGILDGTGLNALDGGTQPASQVATRTLELPRGPVAPSALQVLAAEAAQIGDLGGQVTVDGGPCPRVIGLDAHLTGALPQHAGDGGAVLLEFVAHRMFLL